MVRVHTTVLTLSCVAVFAFAFAFVETVVIDVTVAVPVVVSVSGAFVDFAVVAVAALSALRGELRVRLVVLVAGLENLGCLFALVDVL